MSHLKETLIPSQSDDVLELDELCSFVRIRANKQWLWVALCRQTCQVVAFVHGSRGKESSRRLCKRIPESYKRCQSYNGFWAAYQQVFDEALLKVLVKKQGKLLI